MAKSQFDAHLPNLLAEVFNNPTTGVLKIPIAITLGILAELAQLAIEINDDRLHIMMLRLDLYDVPASERVEEIKKLQQRIKEQNGGNNGRNDCGHNSTDA